MFRDRPVCAACGVALDRDVVEGCALWLCPLGHGAALDAFDNPAPDDATNDSIRAGAGRPPAARRCSHCRSPLDADHDDILHCTRCGVVWLDCAAAPRPAATRFGDSLQHAVSADADQGRRLVALVRRCTISGSDAR